MRARFYLRALRVFGWGSAPIIAAVTINKPLDEVGRYLDVWRAVGGPRSAADRVVLARAPGRDVTELRVEIAPGDGAVRRLLAAPRVRGDLRRFKQIVETGEVLR